MSLGADVWWGWHVFRVGGLNLQCNWVGQRLCATQPENVGFSLYLFSLTGTHTSSGLIPLLSLFQNSYYLIVFNWSYLLLSKEHNYMSSFCQNPTRTILPDVLICCNGKILTPFTSRCYSTSQLARLLAQRGGSFC